MKKNQYIIPTTILENLDSDVIMLKNDSASNPSNPEPGKPAPVRNTLIVK